MWLFLKTYLLLFCCVVSTAFGFDCPIQKYLQRKGYGYEPCTVVGGCVLPDTIQTHFVFVAQSITVFVAPVVILRHIVRHFNPPKLPYLPPSVGSLRRHVWLCIFRI